MKHLKTNLYLVFVISISINCKVQAQFSRYVDFDGTGFGTLYSSSSIATPQGVCADCETDIGVPSGKSEQSYNKQIQALATQRYEEQQREHQREKERLALIERIKKQQKDAGDIQELQRLQEALKKFDNKDARANYNLKSKIMDSLSVFEQQQRIFRNKQTILLKKISQSILDIKVPPPETPPTYKSVLFLGMFQTPEVANKEKAKKLKNPFTDVPYDDIFAFGSPKTLEELKRGPLDHLLGDINLLSTSTFKELARLKGATIENMVAHSNGAKVAEVLIRTNYIKGVKTLRILGGDGALMNIESLQQLANEKGIKIYIYATKADPIPLVPKGWKIMEMAEQLVAPITQFKNVKNLAYDVMGLKEAKASNQYKVQVELLYYNKRTSNPLEPHYYGVYHSIIKGRQLSGCLDKTGNINKNCIIY